MSINLEPHQTKAVSEIKNGSIVKGGVGVGKSRVALTYFFTKVCKGQLRINGVGEYSEMLSPKDLYVITTAKKRDKLDWEKECAPFTLSTHEDACHPGMKVVVDSWNNIMNYTEVKNAFFVFDEQRLVGSGAWVKAFIKIAKINQWIMLSATPGDNWMDYIPVLVANGFYKNRTEFIRRHVVYNNFSKFPKVDHFVETGHLNALRRRIMVDMPYERHTTMHIKNVVVEYNHALFDKVLKDRWNIYKDCPIKDVGELFRIMRQLVNTDASRLNAIVELIEKHPRLIIFYNFNYELEILRTLSDILRVPIAEWNGHNHQEIPDGDKWVYLVQYTAGAEGWNCTSTDAIAYWSLNYSYKLNQQAKGRIERLNTKYTDLYCYVLRSTSAIDRAIMRSLGTKKNFNESDFKIIGSKTHN